MTGVNPRLGPNIPDPSIRMIAEHAAPFAFMDSASPRRAKKPRSAPASTISPLSLPVREALQKLAEIPGIASRHRLATSLGLYWARQDINHAWRCVNDSDLDATTKQLLFNMMMG